MSKKKNWWQRENKKKKRKQKKNYKPKGRNMTEDNRNIGIAVGKVLTDAEFEALKNQHDKGGAFKDATTTVARQGCWDAGIEILSSCDKVVVSPYHIEFHLLSHQKINKLKSFYPHLEWLAYLVGTVNHETHRVEVEDLIIPDSQQVTGASVYNVEYEWPVLPDGKQIIGVIHSHHTMGAFFSGTDDAYINQNHDVSIVVATAKGREILSQIRVKVPCGAYVLAEQITYSVKYPSVLDEDAFETEFKGKISSYTPVVTYVNYGTNYLGNSSRGYSHHRRISGGTNRFQGNPPRNQMDLYNDTGSVWDELEDEFENPYTMSEPELQDALEEYYNPEETKEFMSKGFTAAAQELSVVQQLCAQGLNVQGGSAITEDYDWNVDDEEIVIELEDGVEYRIETDDAHPQVGNTQRGVP